MHTIFRMTVMDELTSWKCTYHSRHRQLAQSMVERSYHYVELVLREDLAQKASTAILVACTRERRSPRQTICCVRLHGQLEMGLFRYRLSPMASFSTQASGSCIARWNLSCLYGLLWDLLTEAQCLHSRARNYHRRSNSAISTRFRQVLSQAPPQYDGDRVSVSNALRQ